MVLIISGILIYLGIMGLYYESKRKKEREQDYRIAERRHYQILSEEQKKQELLSDVEEQMRREASRPKSQRHRHTRTVARDMDGRTIAQEIIEEEFGYE